MYHLRYLLRNLSPSTSNSEVEFPENLKEIRAFLDDSSLKEISQLAEKNKVPLSLFKGMGIYKDLTHAIIFWDGIDERTKGIIVDCNNANVETEIRFIQPETIPEKELSWAEAQERAFDEAVAKFLSEP